MESKGEVLGTWLTYNGIQLSSGGSPSQIPKDTRQEEREALDGNVDEEEAHGADDVVDVEKGSLDMCRRDNFMRISLVFTSQSLSSDPAFPLAQKPALFWLGLHEPRCDQGDNQREQAFEEENVAPCVNGG